MSSWLKRTFDYGKKGKVVVIFDDGKPRQVKRVIFTDPDGTVREFNRTAGTVTVTPAGGKPKTSESPPSKQQKHKDTYTFDKDDWEIVIDDEGEIVWRKKASKKPGSTEEKVKLKGKPGQGEWTHDDGTTDKPDKSSDEDEPNPDDKPKEKPKPDDKPAGGGKSEEKPDKDKKPKKGTPPKKRGR